MKEQTASVILDSGSFAGELERLSSLALAASKDLNDELTLILNQAEISLDVLGGEHPASADLVELQHAALRCAATTRGLLQLTMRARDAVRCAKVRSDRAYTGDRELV